MMGSRARCGRGGGGVVGGCRGGGAPGVRRAAADGGATGGEAAGVSEKEREGRVRGAHVEAVREDIAVVRRGDCEG